MTARLSAGAYLRRRREAAGLPIEDVATITGISLPHLMRIEADETLAGPMGLTRLRVAFPFDPYVYRLLAAGVPSPDLCVTCACSWADPCDDEIDGPCGWATRDLCTRCAARTAAAACLHA